MAPDVLADAVGAAIGYGGLWCAGGAIDQAATRTTSLHLEGGKLLKVERQEYQAIDGGEWH